MSMHEVQYWLVELSSDVSDGVTLGVHLSHCNQRLVNGCMQFSNKGKSDAFREGPR